MLSVPRRKGLPLRCCCPLKNGVVRDLRAALDFLGVRPEVDGGRLGAIGFQEHLRG